MCGLEIESLNHYVRCASNTFSVYIRWPRGKKISALLSQKTPWCFTMFYQDHTTKMHQKWRFFGSNHVVSEDVLVVSFVMPSCFTWSWKHWYLRYLATVAGQFQPSDLCHASSLPGLRSDVRDANQFDIRGQLQTSWNFKELIWDSQGVLKSWKKGQFSLYIFNWYWIFFLIVCSMNLIELVQNTMFLIMLQ